MPFMFENLFVYRRAIDFADEMHRLRRRAPRELAALTDQLLRASISIATNLAEGNGRATVPDRKRFFVMARASLRECVPLLELARRQALLTSAEHESYHRRLEAMARMISGLIRGMTRRPDP